jgi:hypothetical protein
LTRLCLYALAFSTLLSSQETDAHHPPALAALPGQPLNFTQFVPSCQHNSGGFRWFCDSWGTPRCLRLYQSPTSLANRADVRGVHVVCRRRQEGTVLHLPAGRRIGAPAQAGPVPRGYASDARIRRRPSSPESPPSPPTSGNLPRIQPDQATGGGTGRRRGRAGIARAGCGVPLPLASPKRGPLATPPRIGAHRMQGDGPSAPISAARGAGRWRFSPG